MEIFEDNEIKANFISPSGIFIRDSRLQTQPIQNLISNDLPQYSVIKQGHCEVLELMYRATLRVTAYSECRAEPQD